MSTENQVSVDKADQLSRSTKKVKSFGIIRRNEYGQR